MKVVITLEEHYKGHTIPKLDKDHKKALLTKFQNNILRYLASLYKK